VYGSAWLVARDATCSIATETADQGGYIVNEHPVRNLVRNFLIEVAIYGVLIAAYFVVVLRFLREPLVRLFHSNLIVYAFIGLGLIIAQGIVLDLFTSFLLDQLELERLE